MRVIFIVVSGIIAFHLVAWPTNVWLKIVGIVICFIVFFLLQYTVKHWKLLIELKQFNNLKEWLCQVSVQDLVRQLLLDWQVFITSNFHFEILGHVILCSHTQHNTLQWIVCKMMYDLWIFYWMSQKCSFFLE